MGMHIKSYLKPPLRPLKNTMGNDHITYQTFHGKLGKSSTQRSPFGRGDVRSLKGLLNTMVLMGHYASWIPEYDLSYIHWPPTKNLENLHVACGDCSFESPATLSGSILPIFTSLKRYHIKNDSTALTAKNSNW